MRRWFKRREMDMEEWYNYGVDNGFCTPAYCGTHDPMPMHETEERAWEEGGDPCAIVIRIGGPEDWALPDEWFNN